jgi:Ca-activated chloride channel family protein
MGGISTRWALALTWLLAACAGGGDEGWERPSGSLAVTQSGPQDIERFRSILEAGEVPSVDSFDQLGFFAEHAIEQPDADCGHSVCVHPQLAVAPRFDGGNWTMAFASFNTPLTADSLERGPVHVSVVVETSTHTESLIRSLTDGIVELAAGLRDEDRLTVVGFDRRTYRVLDAVAPRDVSPSRIRLPRFGPSETLLYEGLAAGIDAIEAHREELPDARILLVTSGHADGGISDGERIVGLAASAARLGVGISVLGAGDDYDARIPTQIAELGTATLTYASGGEELSALLAAQADLTLVPLATDFELRVQPALGYQVAEVYGARYAWRDGEAVVLQAPGLFLGARTGSQDVDPMVGRRGGGGGVFVRLSAGPDASEDDDLPAGAPAFAVTTRYRDATSDSDVLLEGEIVNALAPGENPDVFWPHFSDEGHAKPFMMLNMWLAIRFALQLYSDGSCAEAMGVSEMMIPSIEAWQEHFDDPDIQADDELLWMLRANIAEECVTKPVPPLRIDAGCFGS